MAQYFPCYKAESDKFINRKLSLKEYKEIEKFVNSLDFKNGFFQDLDNNEEEYVPKFDLSNI